MRGGIGWAVVFIVAAGCGNPAARSLAAPTVASDGAPPTARSLYVATFDERDEALALARERGVRELTLYGLGPFLASDSQAVAAFVVTAHAAGVAVAAPVAGLDRVTALAAFEAQHPHAAFDGWSTELEYWNGPAEERAGRFEGLQALVAAMRAAKGDGWIGCYLGYPSADEAAWIVAHVDRVYLSFAITDPTRALDWGTGLRSHRTRHGYFAGRVPIWPIVYTRGEAHLRPWLEVRSLSVLEAVLTDALGGQLAGVAYFDHRSIREVLP